MGDRFYLKIACAHCGKLNPKPIESDFWEDEYVYYAPTCGFTDFTCDYCGKKNKINEHITASKA